MTLSEFVKEKRGLSKLTQPELAEKAGVGLRFVREMEQGKETLRLDKVNQLLQLFGYEMGPVEIQKNLVLNAATGVFNLQEKDAALKQRKKQK
jgi:y4mF family transcriptional regulator